MLSASHLSSLKSVSFSSMFSVSHLSSQMAREYSKKGLRIPVLRLFYYKILKFQNLRRKDTKSRSILIEGV
uniref:Uncharacterized protein n=1 Tax=Populus trichocarpa TaxID=3694 RepID=A0A3N7GCU2_POPTR